eukprot:CFRG1721T1
MHPTVLTALSASLPYLVLVQFPAPSALTTSSDRPASPNDVYTDPYATNPSPKQFIKACLRPPDVLTTDTSCETQEIQICAQRAKRSEKSEERKAKREKRREKSELRERNEEGEFTLGVDSFYT